MKTIRSLKDIKNTAGSVYVRWSKSIALDNKRGYSLRYGTQAETGLSCCEIDTTWEDWRILRQLNEYSFAGGSCWLITGDLAGIGADNEPLLRNVKLIGKVADNLARADWLLMWRNKMLTEERQRMHNLTTGNVRPGIDIEFCKSSSTALIAKLESSNRDVWQRILYYGA